MEQELKCAICGKDIPIGYRCEDFESITIYSDTFVCCRKCYLKYNDAIKKENKRFSVKLDNLGKDLSPKNEQQTIIDAFLVYMKEREKTKKQYNGLTLSENNNLYLYNGNRNFLVNEVLMNSNVEKQQEKKELNEQKTIPFIKKDISMIEFRLYPDTHNKTINLNASNFVYEVRFNNQKEMTYKPCIAHGTITGNGLLTCTQFNDAKNKVIKLLEDLKKVIKCDLDIVEVKDFT